MIKPTSSLALTAAALGGLILWGCWREKTETARPARPIRPAAAPAGAIPDPPRNAEEQAEAAPADLVVLAAREVAVELQRLQDRRQREWAVEVDQQTRLEWMERYDEERHTLVRRLEPLVSAEILGDIDTWAASQREYGKP